MENKKKYYGLSYFAAWDIYRLTECRTFWGVSARLKAYIRK